MGTTGLVGFTGTRTTGFVDMTGGRAMSGRGCVVVHAVSATIAAASETARKLSMRQPVDRHCASRR